MQKHFEYIELDRVWESIGFSLDDEVLQQWRSDYSVNIAMLDSGVEETHNAFRKQQNPAKGKVSKSFETYSHAVVSDGHGTFLAGVAAGYQVESPENVTESATIEATTKRVCEQMRVPADQFDNVDKLKTVNKLLRQICGSPVESLPDIVGVAPFANIFSYQIKVFDCEEEGLEDHRVALESIRDTNRKESALENKVHIVCIAQALHYNGRMRQAIYDVLNENVIIVAAASNKGQRYNYCNSNIYFPARFGNVITVGSHDGLGQPSKFSSVGREVDFLAYGEQIWGPSIEGRENAVEKDEGTSLSAAIVCGIVAFVLAFVQKEKGPAVRSKISNNPVMREILREMAMKKSGQHTEVMGYGCLKPFHVFRHNAYVLWSLIDRVSETYSLTTATAAAASAKVSKFILSETSVAMHSSVENDLYDNTQEALKYLKKRGLTRHVKLINLRLPLSMTEISPSSKVSLSKDVLPIIQESDVEIIEDLVFPRMEHISNGNAVSRRAVEGQSDLQTYVGDDFFNFIQNLPSSVRSGLKRIVVPNREISKGDISKIKKILSGSVEVHTSVSQFSNVNGNLREVSEGIGHARVECVDEILNKPLNDSQSFYTAKEWHSFRVNDTSLPKSDVQHKVTVAILGDAINIHHNEIKGEIKVDSHFKCFIDPAEGAVEKDRHLGTVCASIIAGKSKGIAPFVDLVYATVINRNKQTKPEWVIAALEWIEREHNEVDIVVVPLGFEQFHLGLFQAINRLSAGNTIVMCAASSIHERARPKICYPAKYGDVICVGSHSSSSQPSSFSPQGREIDLLALGEDIGFSCFSMSNDSSEIITEKYALSGTCIAVACAAGIIAQMVLFSLQCKFERHEITNNTVVRELLRNVTCNFSHSPQSGHGWLTNLFESELFKDSSYFTAVLCEILKKPNPSLVGISDSEAAALLASM